VKNLAFDVAALAGDGTGVDRDATQKY